MSRFTKKGGIRLRLTIAVTAIAIVASGVYATLGHSNPAPKLSISGISPAAPSFDTYDAAQTAQFSVSRSNGTPSSLSSGDISVSNTYFDASSVTVTKNFGGSPDDATFTVTVRQHADTGMGTTPVTASISGQGSATSNVTMLDQ